MMESSRIHQPVEVSTAVNSILAALNSGLDVFKRMLSNAKPKCRSQKRSKASGVDPVAREYADDATLSSQLMRGAKDIENEYRKSVERFGVLAERGDGKSTSNGHSWRSTCLRLIY